MKFKSYAKVNLALDVVSKDKSGYHIIKTVYQQISLFDEIEIEKGENIVIFKGEEAHLINRDKNTVLDAFKLISKNHKLKNSYSITVNKKIPMGTGLGGGSSNAAIVFNAFNKLENLNLSKNDLYFLAREIGMDVPFFIEGGTAIGRNYGEEIETLPDLCETDGWKKLNKILVIPQQRKSTGREYSKLKMSLTGKSKDKTEKMIKCINQKNISCVVENIHNDFEIFADSGFKKIQNALEKSGACKTLLCGSGTSVIGFSKNRFDVKALSRELPHQRILNLTP